jgi:hypothetical protein
MRRCGWRLVGRLGKWLVAWKVAVERGWRERAGLWAGWHSLRQPSISAPCQPLRVSRMQVSQVLLRRDALLTFFDGLVAKRGYEQARAVCRVAVHVHVHVHVYLYGGPATRLDQQVYA